MKTILCPSCGDEINQAFSNSVVLVCPSCHSQVIVSDEHVEAHGKMAVLTDVSSKLALGAQGKVAHKGFDVIGHVRYRYEGGLWDEWFLYFNDGSMAWITQDEEEYTLEEPVADPGDIPPLDTLKPGMDIIVGDARWTVAELGQAQCVGGGGELPFRMLYGERYHYADLAGDGGAELTLEYDKGSAPNAYTGRILKDDEWRVDFRPDDADHGPKDFGGFDFNEFDKAAVGAGLGAAMAPRKLDFISNKQRRILREGSGPKTISCPNCGGELNLKLGKMAKFVKCSHCGSDIDVESNAVLRKLSQVESGPKFHLDIGDKGKLRGTIWQVIGRLRYAWKEDGEQGAWNEYCLYHSDKGIAYLACEDGHWTLFNKAKNLPPNPRSWFSALPKTSLSFMGKTWRVYETTQANVSWVDGELPWVAQAGDAVQSCELISPPHIYSLNMSDNEFEGYQGIYIDHKRLWKAFLKKGDPPEPVGIAPHQEFRRPKVVSDTFRVLGAFAALYIFVAIVLFFFARGKEVYRKSAAYEIYGPANSSGFMPDQFTLEKDKICRVDILTQANNSWYSLDIDLWKVAADGSLSLVTPEPYSAQASYYHGSSGGESWSEGSRSTKFYFKPSEAGTYKLAVKGEWGTGETPITNRPGAPVTIRVRQGAILSRHFLIFGILTGILPMFGFLHHRAFESRRWAPVMPDSDDD